MKQPIETFFTAWGEADGETRTAMLVSCLAKDAVYADPRTPAPINDNADLIDYVGMFSSNAPGWTARVLKSDECAGLIRVTVAFAGSAPDGSEMVQLGQYFVALDADDRIATMTGFVGTGAPE